MKKRLIGVVALAAFGCTHLAAQSPQVVLISPSFNAIATSTQPQISAAFNVPMDSSTFTHVSFAVFGERSGYKTGTITYQNVSRTVAFVPVTGFIAGERVTIRFSRRIRSQGGDSLNGFIWTFQIPVTHPTQGKFQLPIQYNGLGYGMVCVDMNRDGHPDIVTSGGVIRLNNGSGQFNSTWLVSDADWFGQIVAEDFNRDGFMDVLYSGNGIKIGLGNGSGQFIFSTKPSWFFRYETTDLNADGFPDVVGIARYDDTTSLVSIALNDGQGQFTDTLCVQRIGGWFRNIAVADIDNDGDVDVFVLSHRYVSGGPGGFNGLLVCRNNGDGTFTQADHYPTSTYFLISFPEHIGLADFNNDGWVDAEVLSSGGGFVSLNLGGGIFGVDTSHTRNVWGPELAYPLAVGDFNGDRWIDFVVSGYPGLDTVQTTFFRVRPNCPGIFRGCGGPGYYADTLGYNLFIRAVQATDVDADGDLDFVSVGQGVFVSINSDPPLTVKGIFERPNAFLLGQNFPNPFNPSTQIEFAIPTSAIVELKIFDVLGKEMATLVHERREAGRYSEVFDAGGLSSGVYLYRLKAGSFSRTMKMIVVR